MNSIRNDYLKKIVNLLIFDIFIFTTGILLIDITDIEINPTDFSLLLFIFSLITLAYLLVFIRGRKKSAEGSTLHLLTATAVKLFSEMILALVWFVAVKKIAVESVILFFVLYLAFTLFSILIVLNTLKTKSLDNTY